MEAQAGFGVGSQLPKHDSEERLIAKTLALMMSLEFQQYFSNKAVWTACDLLPIFLWPICKSSSGMQRVGC